MKVACLWFCIAGVVVSAAQTSNPQQSAQAAPLLRRGADALHVGDLSGAAEAFVAATQVAPQMAEAFLNVGLVRERQGQHREAIAALERSIALKPTLRGAHLFLGIAEYRLDRFDLASAALQKEVQINSQDANAWMWLGINELAAKSADSALEALNRAAQLSPENVDILYHRGQALVQASRQNYDRMFRIAPDSWRVHQVLAQGFSEHQRDDEAITEYRAAIAIAPNEPGLHQLLATALWRANKAPEAIQEYRMELHIDPGNTTATYQLGALLVDQSSEDGRGLIESAIQRNPALPAASYYLGRAFMIEGKDDSAIRAFRKELTQQPSPEYEQQSYYQLARLYRRTGQTQEADKAVESFRALEKQQREHRTEVFAKQRRRAGGETDSLLPPPTAEPMTE